MKTVKQKKKNGIKKKGYMKKKYIMMIIFALHLNGLKVIKQLI